MIINQLAVYTPNTTGNVYKVLKILGDNSINIECLNIADTLEFGILRMITDDNQKALKLLTDNGFMANTCDLVSVKVKNEPGDLEKVLKKFSDKKIDIEYIYSYSKDDETSILIKTDNLEEAKELIK